MKQNELKNKIAQRLSFKGPKWNERNGKNQSET